MSTDQYPLERLVASCLSDFGLPGDYQAPVLYWPMPRWLPRDPGAPSPAEFGTVAQFAERFAHVLEIGVPWCHASLLGYLGSVPIVDIAVPSYTSPDLAGTVPALNGAGLSTQVKAREGKLTDDVLTRVMPAATVAELHRYIERTKLDFFEEKKQ